MWPHPKHPAAGARRHWLEVIHKTLTRVPCIIVKKPCRFYPRSDQNISRICFNRTEQGFVISGELKDPEQG